jgi:hypothetical protein
MCYSDKKSRDLLRILVHSQREKNVEKLLFFHFKYVTLLGNRKKSKNGKHFITSRNGPGRLQLSSQYRPCPPPPHPAKLGKTPIRTGLHGYTIVALRFRLKGFFKERLLATFNIQRSLLPQCDIVWFNLYVLLLGTLNAYKCRVYGTNFTYIPYLTDISRFSPPSLVKWNLLVFQCKIRRVSIYVDKVSEQNRPV